MMSSIRFSLVVCTLGRYEELERLFNSLEEQEQTYRNFEVILVDQNEKGFLDNIVEKYSEKFQLKHIYSEKGLSKARNVGLRHIKGEIVAFPDDDCWYPKDLLGRVNCFFQQNPKIDGLTSYTKGEDGEQSVQKFNLKNSYLTKYNVWTKANSTTIFIRSSCIKNHDIDFDEKLGVGANTAWGAGEDIDFLLRLIKKDCKIYFATNYFVYHPHLKNLNKDRYMDRNISYANGTGYVIKKNDYSILYLLYTVLRSFLGGLLSFFLGDFYKAKVRFSKVKGFLQGWLSI